MKHIKGDIMRIYFFAVCDFLCRFIPVRRWRWYMRRVKLFDWYRKYNALKRSFPDLDFYDVKMVMGDWYIGFIVEGRFIFKVRKNIDTKVPQNELIRIKRITDALGPIAPIRIVCTRVAQAGEYMFYRYPVISGKNLNSLSIEKITAKREKLGRQIARIIYKLHNARPVEINDLKIGDGDGWNHNNLANSMLVNEDNMDIIGIVDWEHVGWGRLETEIANATAGSDILRDIGLDTVIREEYDKIVQRNTESQTTAESQD